VLVFAAVVTAALLGWWLAPRLNALVENLASELGSANAELAREQAALEHSSTHDLLTGLPNRALLLDRIRQSLAHSLRYETWTAVLFVDLDDFSTVNDSLGHDAGDELLVQVADRLSGAIRRVDTVARLGGDDFVVVAGELNDEAGAERVATRLQTAMTETIRVAGVDVRTSLSIGVVNVGPDDAGATDPSDLVRDSDAAMFKAKRHGKQRHEFFSKELTGAAEARRRLEVELHDAVAGGEFDVFYQPIVTATDGGVVGLEALVRWNHPTEGILPPVHFLDALEQTGLIVDVGETVLRRACADVAHLDVARLGVADVPWLSVNLSARQLGPELTSLLPAVIRESGLQVDRLRLEITETALQEASVDALAELRAIRDLGFAVGLDDFGTGYTTLSRLNRFDVDFLKVDKSFVTGIEHGRPVSIALTGAILRLGEELEMDTIVEGVETADQAAELERLGARLLQGYRFARPAPLEQIVERMRSAATSVG